MFEISGVVAVRWGPSGRLREESPLMNSPVKPFPLLLMKLHQEGTTHEADNETKFDGISVLESWASGAASDKVHS